MEWLPFALFTAIFVAGRKTYEKSLTDKFSNFTMGFITVSFALIPTGIMCFYFQNPPNILTLPWGFWWPLLVIWLILYPIQTHFYYEATRNGQLSQVTPIQALMPVLNSFTSWLFLREHPTWYGAFGIAIIVVATYLTMFKEPEPGQKRAYTKESINMIIAVICFAIGTTLDKVSLEALKPLHLQSAPLLYSFINGIGATIVFVILILLHGKVSEMKMLPKNFLVFAVVGAGQALAFSSKIYAFSKGPTAYSSAVISLNFLLTTFFAIYFFKEKLNRRQIIALFLFLIGIGLLTITL